MTGVVVAPLPVAHARAVQRRTLAVLFVAQMVGGVGIAIGFSVGALLTATMAGTSLSGLAQSAAVVGGALFAVPVSRLMRARGRRPGLAVAYVVGAVGSALIVLAALLGAIPLLFLGLFLFGGANTGSYQARYAAVDLAEPTRRGRQLSLVVWATTIGAVAGPNLAPLADSSVHRYGLATFSGPFVFSALAFLVAGGAILFFLRPDPLLTAQTLAAGPVASSTELGTSSTRSTAATAGSGLRAAVREVTASPGARLGIAAVAMGHLVMIGVMAMTPVHIGEAGAAGSAGHAGAADTLRIVGIVLSVHIAGMYALSPITGWLTDRVGRRPVILGGVALLVAACAVAGTAGHDTIGLSIGLALLGMGWSGTMVAGSTLLSESVGVGNKPAVQGLSDLVMGLSGACAGAVSGVIVAWSSYATLTMLAAVATVPLIALALRPVRPALAEGV
jgi:MFS family permease